MYLKNIEKIFKLIPTTFIFVLCVVSIGITYVILESKEQNEKDLVVQKMILQHQFYKKELLNNFNAKIQEKIDHELIEIKKVLQEHTFKIIGSISHRKCEKDSQRSIEFLQEYEKKHSVFVVLIDESNLDIIHGEEEIGYLSKLVFNQEDANHKKIILQYIYSQGKHNLQEWKDDISGIMRVSFFDKFTFGGKKYLLGTLSSEEKIRQITKELIIKEIDLGQKDSKSYVWFYDHISEELYNFYNERKYIKLDKLLQKLELNVQEKFLNKLISNGDTRLFFNHIIYHDNWNSFSTAIHFTDDLQTDTGKIELNYRYMFIEYVFFILVITILLLLTSRHFIHFIKVQVNAQELQQKVEEELEKNRQKDRILIQQSKLAAMGEMLGNIAHQWRQPLNNVSLFLQFLETHYAKDTVDKAVIKKYFKKSFTQITYMSQTIDDFRNFYKPSKQKSNFFVSDAIDQALDIIMVQLKDKDIKVLRDIDKVLLYSFENELKQSLLNILNNAHDAIQEKRKESLLDPYINIEVKKQKNSVQIKISNNGGSIDEDVMQRIFEPYFTTKFESQGTGVGLYMTKTIIEMNLHGTIAVENFEDGVSFIINLPKGEKE
jgi:signal transduction histidine kinase